MLRKCASRSTGSRPLPSASPRNDGSSTAQRPSLKAMFVMSAAKQSTARSALVELVVRIGHRDPEPLHRVCVLGEAHGPGTRFDGKARRVSTLRPRMFGAGEQLARAASACRVAAYGARVGALGTRSRNPTQTRRRSGWSAMRIGMGLLLRDLPPGIGHLLQNPAGVLSLDLLG